MSYLTDNNYKPKLVGCTRTPLMFMHPFQHTCIKPHCIINHQQINYEPWEAIAFAAVIVTIWGFKLTSNAITIQAVATVSDLPIHVQNEMSLFPSPFKPIRRPKT